MSRDNPKGETAGFPMMKAFFFLLVSLALFLFLWTYSTFFQPAVDCRQELLMVFEEHNWNVPKAEQVLNMEVVFDDALSTFQGYLKEGRSRYVVFIENELMKQTLEDEQGFNQKDLERFLGEYQQSLHPDSDRRTILEKPEYAGVRKAWVEAWQETAKRTSVALRQHPRLCLLNRLGCFTLPC